MTANYSSTDAKAEPVCSICLTPLEADLKEPGIWRCECIFEESAGSWTPRLTANETTEKDNAQ